MAMIDIDYFKNYNDRYGHIKGDECLKAIAASIEETVLDSAFFARYGGEEFAIVFTGCSDDFVKDKIKEVVENVEALNIPHEKSDVSDCVTVSAGVKTIVPSQWVSAGRLVQDADRLLYMAKGNGRNGFCCEGPGNF